MRLKSFVLVEKDNKYLVIQEANEKWKGKWYLPGGGVKDDETSEAGGIRETLEETGFIVELVSVFFVKYHSGFFNRKISVYYFGKITGGIIKTLPDDDSLAVKWIAYEELDKMPLRKNLKELITIYRSHFQFLPVQDFKLPDN